MFISVLKEKARKASYFQGIEISHPSQQLGIPLKDVSFHYEINQYTQKRAADGIKFINMLAVFPFYAIFYEQKPGQFLLYLLPHKYSCGQ